MNLSKGGGLSNVFKKFQTSKFKKKMHYLRTSVDEPYYINTYFFFNPPRTLLVQAGFTLASQLRSPNLAKINGY